MSSLALFSPMSLGAGAGLVSLRDAMRKSVAFGVHDCLSDKDARTAGPSRTPSFMHRLLLTLVMGAAALCAHAQSADPLHSRECAAARGALEQALDDASAKRAGARERLAMARKDAIAACLGRESGNAKRSGAPEPAIAVTAPAIEPAPAVRPTPALTVPPPPLVMPRAAAVTVCDVAGCWDSEGRRLNNLGPMLAGPRGACALVAGVVQCP